MPEDGQPGITRKLGWCSRPGLALDRRRGGILPSQRWWPPLARSDLRRLRNQPLIGPGGFVRADQERSSGLGLGLIRCGALEPVRWGLEAGEDGITAQRTRDCDG